MCNHCNPLFRKALAVVAGYKPGDAMHDRDFDKLANLIAPHMSKHDFQYLEVGNEVYERVKLLAGPHGHAIAKMMKARRLL